MKNKQNYAVFTILLSIVITSCTANNKPFDSVSETQTSEAVTAAVSAVEKIDSMTETEQSISDTEEQTVPITETEAEPVFMENAEKLDLECGKTTSEERDLDTILQEDYKSPMVEWSPDERYAAVVETTENYSLKSGFIKVFDTETNTVTNMPYLEIQNCIHAEVSDTVNLYTCDLLSCEWVTDDILKVNFDMKTGVSFYNQSNFGWYTYNLTEGKVTALSYEMEIPEPVENTMTDEEIKAVIDENLDILMTDSDEYYSEKEFIDAHPKAFENIIAMGEAALPYLQEIVEEHPHRHIMHQQNLCGVVAEAAAYTINPGLYDLIYISPDEKYILKAQIGTFFGTEWGGRRIIEYNKLSIIDNSTKHILINTTVTLTNRYYGLYTNLEVNWSPDSQYVAVQSSDIKTYTTTDIFDIKNIRLITLPSADEILSMTSNNDYYDYTESIIGEWLQNNIVKINVFLRHNISYFIEGFYTYNFDEDKIVIINCDQSENIVSADLSINDDLYVTNNDIYVIRSDGADINIKASYPVLHMTDVSISELINQQIHDYIDEKYSHYYTNTPLVANDTLSSKMLYEITLFNENTLSIHFYGTFSGFGAPAFVEDYAFTFDLQTGKQIAISDLYSDEQINRFINTYFDEFDESAYPILMNLYDKETIRGEFIKTFNSENDDSPAFYNSYYISYDKLYLIAGWYEEYTFDINSPVSGRRAITAEVDIQTIE